MSGNAPAHKWTVMVYLAGDNNLTEECVYSLKGMKEVDTGDRIKVTAQFDPRGRKTPVHRYAINKLMGAAGAAGGGGKSPHGKISDDVTPVVEGTKKYPHGPRGGGGAPQGQQAQRPAEGAEANTADPKTLFDFISWSVENYPAERYMVVLSGHGGGTEEDFLLKDENPRGSLSIPDLERVFRAVKEVLGVEVDVLGMDVCLMSMGEVCYQLRGLVKYIVSAEGYSATAGWPYDNILKNLDASLQAGEEVSPEALGRLVVREYTTYYSEYMVGGFSSDLSVMDAGLPAMTALADSVRALTGLLGQELSRGLALKEQLRESEFLDQVVLAHWEAQSYNGERFADLYDFCALLGQRYRVRELPEGAGVAEREDNERRARIGEAVEVVKRGIAGGVVKLSCYSGVDYQYSYGISVYFPWAEVGPHYKNLDFAADSGWGGFLEAYTEATRRRPRGYRPGKLKLWANVERFRTSSYRTSSYRVGDPPVYSMRNPPQTLTEAGQSPCLREEVEMISQLDISFFK
jgi:hypothetical protein